MWSFFGLTQGLLLHKRPAQLAQLLLPLIYGGHARDRSQSASGFLKRAGRAGSLPSALRTRTPTRACTHAHTHARIQPTNGSCGRARTLIHICLAEKKAAGEKEDRTQRAIEPIGDNGGVIGSGAAHPPGRVAFKGAQSTWGGAASKYKMTANGAARLTAIIAAW